jgi:hypothetical protein
LQHITKAETLSHSLDTRTHTLHPLQWDDSGVDIFVGNFDLLALTLTVRICLFQPSLRIGEIRKHPRVMPDLFKCDALARILRQQALEQVE